MATKSATTRNHRTTNGNSMENISTTRTLLRRLRPSDLSAMRLLESDPLVMQFTPSRVPQSLEQTRKRLEGQIAKQSSLAPFGVWAAELKADSEFVGWFMLNPLAPHSLELGYMLIQEYWGKGLATEVCRALIEFSKTQDSIKEIIAKTNFDNDSSIRVLEKLGFIYNETTTKAEPVLGGNIQIKTFSLALL